MKATRAEARQSLSVRLGWRLAAVMLVGILLAAAAVAWRAIATVHELDDSALQTQARLIASRLPASPDADGRVALPENLIAPFRASDGDNVFLVFQGDRLAAASDAIAAAHLAPFLRNRSEAGFFRLPAMPDHVHGMVGLDTRVGPWRIVVLQGREQTGVLLDSLVENFLLESLWLLLPIGIATILVGVLTLRRGLRSLRQASAAAALVGPTRPGARLPVGPLPREIAPLVLAVNDALTRLEHALVTQRRFMADAAHALRTPLAVLTARLDSLDDHPALGALRSDADRMARLVGQLLRMARLESLPLDVTQWVNLRAVAVEAITALMPIALQRGVDLELRESTVPLIRGNHAALVLAVTNLVENALSYAPPESAVEITVTSPAAITVLDRGPGVAVKDRERIFGRFERGSAPRDGGAGLGLAIVAGIAAAHGGTACVTERAGGGAAFVLALRQMQDAPDEPRPPSPPRPSSAVGDSFDLYPKG
ncbi:MAG TPA: HAMP domain-containing sensor histidine kinase [Stellaceae bacterium]|nr:HAMP domain-containing sensor histidine kinase [Stellaceae bacterium]